MKSIPKNFSHFTILVHRIDNNELIYRIYFRDKNAYDAAMDAYNRVMVSSQLVKSLVHNILYKSKINRKYNLTTNVLKSSSKIDL